MEEQRAPFRAHRKQKEGRGSPPLLNFFIPCVTVNFDFQLHWLTKYLGHEWGIPFSVSVRTFPKSVGGAIPQAGDSDWTQEANSSPKNTSVWPFSTYWCVQMWAVTLCSRHHSLASLPQSWWAVPSNRAYINSSPPSCFVLGVCHSRGERKTAGIMSEGSTVSYQHYRVCGGKRGTCRSLRDSHHPNYRNHFRGQVLLGESLPASQREIKGWN